jgi:hypothetical protein
LCIVPAQDKNSMTQSLNLNLFLRKFWTFTL